VTPFLTAALVVLLVPGPGVLYLAARSGSQGYRAGLISVLGLSAGALVHVAAATAGLSAILLTSATAFATVKLAGAGYLMYLGARTLLTRGPAATPEAPAPAPTRRIFGEGMLVSVLNPKLALFFLAFLPQFVNPAAGPVTGQVLRLGLLYVGLALVTDSSYALLAGSLARRLGARLTGCAWPRYTSGLVYLGLGLGTALSGRKS